MKNPFDLPYGDSPPNLLPAKQAHKKSVCNARRKNKDRWLGRIEGIVFSSLAFAAVAKYCWGW